MDIPPEIAFLLAILASFGLGSMTQRYLAAWQGDRSIHAVQASMIQTMREELRDHLDSIKTIEHDLYQLHDAMPDWTTEQLQEELSRILDKVEEAIDWIEEEIDE